MTVLLVGADRLGNIPKELRQYGCEEIIHWDGRKVQDKKIPQKVDMVLMFHDYLNHSLMGKIKEEAKKRNLPVLFSRRGTVDIMKTLQHQQLR